MKYFINEIISSGILYNIACIFGMVILLVICRSVNKWIANRIEAGNVEAETSAAAAAEVTNRIKESLITRACNLVERMVVATNQLFVESLKKSDSFTKDDETTAFNKTWDNVIALMSDEVMSAIEEEYSDFNEWLKLTIQAFVNVHKYDYLKETAALVEVPAGTIAETLSEIQNVGTAAEALSGIPLKEIKATEEKETEE
ncbi:MAG: hypothetical protein ACI38A_06095 [Candidatus Ornithomonoglobus sp.]